MKSIGIKLADGTFYPILQEGKADNKMLDLTTVKDNQTTVKIDLYRSESGTMDDAEYVDTLEIKNLVPHPNGEPDLSLSVNLDDKNELSAEVVDSETGKHSTANVTLVSRTLAERTAESGDSVADAAVGAASGAGLMAAAEALKGGKESKDADDAFAAPPADDFSFDDIADENFSKEKDSSVVDAADDVPDEADDAVKQDEELLERETAKTDEPFDFDIPASDADGGKKDDFTDTLSFAQNALAEDDETKDAPEDVDAAADKAVAEFNLPDVPDFDLIDKDTSAEPSAEETAAEPAEEQQPADTAIPDPFADEPAAASEAVASEKTVAASEPADTAIPDPFAAEPAGSDFTEPSTEAVTAAEPAAADDTFGTAGSLPSSVDTLASESVPEEPAAEGPSAEATDKTPMFKESEYSVPDFDLPKDLPTDMDTFFADQDKKEPVTEEKETQPGGQKIDFSDLYDKETMAGEHASDGEEEDSFGTKTKTPVIICIVCAVICIVATILVLFVVPSRINLIKSRNTKAMEAAAVEVPAPAEPAAEPAVPAEPAPVEPAKPDEVVVAETPIVPEQPAEPAEAPKDIQYKIKWGDTLWDLADTYYKNPWRYHYLAKYNKIKNPDLIISGHYLTVPAK